MKKLFVILLMSTLPLVASADMLSVLKSQIEQQHMENERVKREISSVLSETESCAKGVQGFKIAGISTLTLTAIGAGANIYLGVKNKDAKEELKRLEAEKAKKEAAAKAKTECEKDTKKEYKDGKCIDKVATSGEDKNTSGVKTETKTTATDDVLYAAGQIYRGHKIDYNAQNQSDALAAMKQEFQTNGKTLAGLQIYGRCASNEAGQLSIENPNNEDGSQCFCRIVADGKNSKWVSWPVHYVISGGNDFSAACAQSCAENCAEGIIVSAGMRQAFLHALGILSF